jgi:hypothetical protein
MQVRLVTQTRTWNKPWRRSGYMEFVQTTIHEAEVSLAQILTRKQFWAELPRIQRSIDDYLPEEDPRRRWVDDWLNKRTKHSKRRTYWMWPHERARLISALRWSYYVCSINRGRLRTFQRMLTYAALLLVTVLIALALVRAFAWPQGGGSLICFKGDQRVCPTITGQSGSTDFAAVEVSGALGGLIATIFTVARSRKTLDPYGLHAAQGFLKMTAGGLTALLGVALLSASKVVQVTDPIQILVFAVVFGYSQELFTHLISSKEEALLKSALPVAGAK